MGKPAHRYGIGVAPGVSSLGIARVVRSGVRWVYGASVCVPFGRESLSQRCRMANDAWMPFRDAGPWMAALADWFAILDPWGILSGAGQDNKGTYEGRRLTLTVGQVMQWALQGRPIDPVLFEPGEIRRGLGAQAESDNRRLAACLRGMVVDCPATLTPAEAEAIATAVMGGRHYLGPPALLKGKRL